MAYVYTDNMCEISGFGGGYELCCRAMVVAGLEWLDAHPGAKPEFHGWRGIYGVIVDDNEDAKALSLAIEEAAKAQGRGGATGAMHQAAVTHILTIRDKGWDWYVAEMRQPDAKAEGQEP
jgi:hypothetical protein